MMYLALEKPSTFTDHAIDRLTGHRGYSHVDLLFSDGWFFTSIAFKSKLADGRRVPSGVVLMAPRPHPLDQWDLLPLNVTPEQEAVIRAQAQALVGRPYDWLGLARFVFPFVGESSTRYFCSEAVVEVFQPATPAGTGLIPYAIQGYKISPNDITALFLLYRLIGTPTQTLPFGPVAARRPRPTTGGLPPPGVSLARSRIAARRQAWAENPGEFGLPTSASAAGWAGCPRVALGL